MSFGSGFTRETVIDEDLAARLVNTALDAGVNLIDTADTYGGKYGLSETVLGRVVAARRDEVLLATKMGFGDLGPNVLTHDNVIATCEGSLQRMGVDHIDLYQLHRPDRTVPLEETLGALEELVTRGLVREIGMSNYYAWEVGLAQGSQRTAGRRRISSMQIPYSLLQRDVEHEILPYCLADDVGTLIYAPLAAGQLTGWRDTPGAAGRRKGGGMASGDAARLRTARAVIDAIARARGVSMAQVGLAWLLAQPGVTSAIVGPSKVEQLEDNLRAVDLVLAEQELHDLSAATEPEWHYPGAWNRSFQQMASSSQPWEEKQPT
jgi:aryl-alcohol dehydrogenase-like predicted oxidoreductase